MTKASSNPFSITVSKATSQPISGLNFPSNGDATDAFVAFQFLNPHLDGLPLFGPGGQGATYIYRYLPRSQAGYYTVFFHSRGDGGVASPSASYCGAHPYPLSGASDTNHVWEIAAAGDNTYTQQGPPNRASVVYNSWRTVILRVVRNSSNSKTFTLWIDAPSTRPQDMLEATITQVGWGESTAPSPALTFGDAPWHESLPWKHERLSGILRGIKIFNIALSDADILAEATSESIATSAGQSNIWYLKPNPTPGDLRCDAGTGREPRWAESTTASLWTP